MYNICIFICLYTSIYIYMYACSTSSYANHKLWWSVSAKKANLWCPQLAWNLRLKVCLCRLCLGSSWPWATSCGSPVNGRFAERWNKGWELFFFPRYTSKSSRKNCPSLTFWSNVGDISRFSGDVRTAQRSSWRLVCDPNSVPKTSTASLGC